MSLKYTLDDLFEDDIPEAIELPELADTPSFQEVGGQFESGKYVGGNANFQDIKVGGISGTFGAVFYTKQYVYTAFESADGWTNGANLNVQLGGSAIQTSNTINTKKNINDEIMGGGGVYFTTKNPGFQCGLECDATTQQIIYFGAGDLHIGDDTETGFGFKIVNGTLYALHTVSPGFGNPAVEYTTEITGITLTDSNEYKAIYTSNTKIEFYVNNVLKATHTTNLLTSNNDNSPTLMSFSIKNTEAVNKVIYLRYAMFFQDF